MTGLLSASWPRGADAPPPQFPFVCLLVSGGHNLLLLVHGVGDYTQLGTTVDDALGAPGGLCAPSAQLTLTLTLIYQQVLCGTAAALSIAHGALS
jgi:hypothetical protein